MEIHQQRKHSLKHNQQDQVTDMNLITLSSSSTANGYLLTNGSETLIIEAGVKLPQVKKTLNFNMATVAGCIVSHQHGDHSRAMVSYLDAGIKVLSSQEVFEFYETTKYAYLTKSVKQGFAYKLGNFKIIPFDLNHDVKCLGYLIEHPETGLILFITDTFMCEYVFPGLNQVILECNYADDILERNIASGSVMPAMRPRLMKSHMELETTKGILQANDLSGVINIVLVHLSSGNSDEARFIREVRELTGKTVFAADKGLNIDFNKQPF